MGYPGGGCILNRSLADLTLLDIIKAADEEFFLNPCLDSQYQCGYAASFDGCKVHCELARVQRVLEEELKRKPYISTGGIHHESLLQLHNL